MRADARSAVAGALNSLPGRGRHGGAALSSGGCLGGTHGISSAGQGTGLSLKLIPDSGLKTRVLPVPEPITTAPGLPACRKSTGRGRRPSTFLG